MLFLGIAYRQKIRNNNYLKLYIMKKVYFMAFIATAALTMMSCSNDDITTVSDLSKSEATAINFSTYLGRNVESRAAVTTDNLTKIGVYAAYTGSESWSASKSLDFMMNQEVTKSAEASSWSYSPLKYWPANEAEKISFFAYAPVNNTAMTMTTNTTDGHAPTGAPQAIVTVDPTNLTNTPDLVVGSKIDQTKIDKVSFTLKHAMTRVAMQAKVGTDIDSKSKVVVTGVKLTSTSELNTKAKFTFPSTETDNGTWTAESGSAKELDLAKVLNSNSTEITGATAKGTILSTTAASVYNDYLYLIPAIKTEGTGASAEGTVNVEISYAIVTEDAALANKSVTTTATKTVKLPAGALAQGKSYKFTFTIGVNAIVLDVQSVEGWGTDVTNTDINN